MSIMQERAIRAARADDQANPRRARLRLTFGCIQTIDSCIARAVAAKSMEDQRQSRVNWKRIEQSAALFVADEQA
jgi:hypothetical protein